MIDSFHVLSFCVFNIADAFAVGVNLLYESFRSCYLVTDSFTPLKCDFMKKIFALLLLLSAATSGFATPAINEKVLKVFQTAFPAVQNAKWSEFENFYQVYFDNGDVKCRIQYDFNGQVLSAIRYYGESLVSPFLKAKLAQKFPGKTIFGVTEMNSSDEMYYEFVLEDAKSWLKVRSDGTGQMTVTEKFKKADS